MKAIILSRVSSKEQEEGHSIAAQGQRLKDYCSRKQFNVLRVFELVESSTRGERKEFQAMLEFAKGQGETVAIVADAVDRVQRGFKESVLLDELIRKGTIELHFLREAMVIGINASASDLMRWDYSVVGAKHYVINLSENVKRSIQYKLKNGEWIGPAPIGYLNARDPVTYKATLEVDPVRAPLVVRIFEQYVTGAYSINELTRLANGWGLRNKTKKGGVLSVSQVHNILRNPFYAGKMDVNNCLYPHRYEPLITLALFNHCEDIRQGRNRVKAPKQTKHPFVFRSLLTCAVSGRKVTCDIKKGQYVYLICRDPVNPEKLMYVAESKILQQVQDVLDSIKIPDALLEALLDHLKQSHEAEKDYHHHAIDALQKEGDEIQVKLDRLIDLLLDKSITKETYEAKVYQLKQRQYLINQELYAHNSADFSFKNTVGCLVSVASRAHKLFNSSKSEQKRHLINFMFSNLKLRGEKLEYALRSPFHTMVKPESYQEWLRG